LTSVSSYEGGCGFEVIFPRAEERIDSVIDFLLIEWGFQSQQKFMAELKYCFKIIEINPF
uniref:hypothetical protein n=1 Tax=Bacteroides finegoldii TaxID=338188 RepID=UPI0022E29CD1